MIYYQNLYWLKCEFCGLYLALHPNGGWYIFVRRCVTAAICKFAGHRYIL